MQSTHVKLCNTQALGVIMRLVISWIPHVVVQPGQLVNINKTNTHKLKFGLPIQNLSCFDSVRKRRL
jgi:hypothetical protein